MNKLCGDPEQIVGKASIGDLRQNYAQRCTRAPQLFRVPICLQDLEIEKIFDISRIRAALIYYY